MVWVAGVLAAIEVGVGKAVLIVVVMTVMKTAVENKAFRWCGDGRIAD